MRKPCRRPRPPPAASRPSRSPWRRPWRPPPPGPAARPPPAPSGLGWVSGATAGGFPCLADLRGRPLDASHTYLTDTTFDGMVKQSAGWLQREAKRAPFWVVSMGLLPSGSKGQFAQCAAGAFDRSYRLIGANLQGPARRAPSSGSGWEANLGSNVHPWGVDHKAPDPRLPRLLAPRRRGAQAGRARHPGRVTTRPR